MQGGIHHVAAQLLDDADREMCIRDSQSRAGAGGYAAGAALFHRRRAAPGGATQAAGLYQRSGGVPVSYTHLDVYKRQPLNPGFSWSQGLSLC